MAAQKVYIPMWKDGVYYWVAVNGTFDTAAKVPEGEPCISARAVDSTPSARLQPDPAAPIPTP